MVRILMNKSKRSRLFLLLLPCLLVGLLTAADPRPFAHEISDLEADPAVVWGTLENGLRYAVLPNSEPPGRLSLRLLVEAGRLEESDDQIGAAHFLEHMVFNGTEHFAPGELVRLFQRLGMGFGAHTNAYTSFSETVYMFELPDAEEATLGQSFLALRDYADGALLLPEEVEKERGIILSERRDRDTAGRRSAEDAYRFLLPYAKFAARISATIEHTQSLTREDLLEFYETWYSAERLAVIVVGDIEPERAVSLIEEYFGDVRAHEEATEEVALGQVFPRGEAYRVFVDGELSGTEIALATVAPHEGKPDVSTERRKELSRAAAVAMLNRRLDRLARSDNPPFLQAVSYRYDISDFAHVAGIQANVADAGQWEEALAAIQTEIRRALEYGFTEEELAVFLANERTALRRAAAQAPTRESRVLANLLSSSIHGDRVFRHPEQDLALYGDLLDELTVGDALASLRAAWDHPSRLVRMQTPQKIDRLYPDLKLAYRANLEQPVEPVVEGERVEFAYTDFGPAGPIVDRYDLRDLDAEQVIFDNNVVLSLKRTDFEQNRIRVAVRFGTGLLGLSPDQAGLDSFAGLTFTQGGLEAHSVDDLETILAGHTVGADLSVETESFVLRGTTTPEDLTLQLQLLAAYLVAPGYRPEAERQARQIIPQFYRQLEQTLDGVYAREVPRFLASGDPRFGYPDESVMSAHTLASVRAWLTPALSRQKMEIAVVGDIDPDVVVAAVGATFGALPEREMVVPENSSARIVELPEPASEGRFTYLTDNPKARLQVVWPTADQKDIHLSRRLSVMAGIVSDRLREKVREEIGEAYSPYAYNHSSGTFTDYGYTAAVIDAEPGSLPHLLNIVHEIGDELATDGFDEDEFERVLNPRLSSLREQERDNGYWLTTVLLGSHQYPRQLEWARSLFVDYPAITRDEVLALAEQYLASERALHVIVEGQTPETE